MKKILILLILKLFITSCATPTVVNVIQPKDNELNCKELNSDHVAAMEQGARIFSLFKPYAKGNVKLNLCAYNQGYRCKGEKGPKYVESGMGYANKVKRFQRRLKRQLRKDKKRIDKLTKIVWHAINNFKGLL